LGYLRFLPARFVDNKEGDAAIQHYSENKSANFSENTIVWRVDLEDFKKIVEEDLK